MTDNEEKLDRFIKAFCTSGAFLFRDGLKQIEVSNPELYLEVANDINEGSYKPCVLLEINPTAVVGLMRTKTGEAYEVFKLNMEENHIH